MSKTLTGFLQEKSDLQFSKNIKPAADVKSADAKEGKAPAPAAKEEISWIGADGKVLKKETLDSLMSQLSNLSCDEYLEGKTKEDYKNPVYELRLKGKKDYFLKLFKKPEDGGKYPAISSENPYPFLLSSHTADNLMKKPEDLIEGAKKEEDKGEKK